MLHLNHLRLHDPTQQKADPEDTDPSNDSEIAAMIEPIREARTS